MWKTTNGGTTWPPVFDDYGTTSVGAVAVAPSNPAIVWAGTGEANNRQSSSWGNGVDKSTDAGAVVGNRLVSDRENSVTWLSRPR